MSFRNLSDLHVVHWIPVAKARSVAKPPLALASFLEKQFQSTHYTVQVGPYTSQDVPSIQFWELEKALKQMARGNCRDRAGGSLEMLLHGGDALPCCLLGMYNSMIRNDEFDSSWKETVFVMLPKTGDLDDPANWRLIAVLRVCYKLFARIIYNRIRVTLDGQQSEDQMGFRPERGTEDALSILESVVGKCIEFNVSLWLASLDLRKAFHRIEWPQLFAALEEQGLPLGCRSVLHRLYCGQSGFLASGEEFLILRGVRKGDVLSPVVGACRSQMEEESTQYRDRH